MKEGMKCFFCDKGKFKKNVKDEIFEYKGEKVKIKNYTTYECNHCKESIVSKESLKASRKPFKDLQRRVDGLLTSDEIKRIREKFGFTQKELADMCGVSEKYFTRYENGYVTQPPIVDIFLRALDSYPVIFSEITKKSLKKLSEIADRSFTVIEKEYATEKKETKRKLYATQAEKINLGEWPIAC